MCFNRLLSICMVLFRNWYWVECSQSKTFSDRNCVDGLQMYNKMNRTSRSIECSVLNKLYAQIDFRMKENAVHGIMSLVNSDWVPLTHVYSKDFYHTYGVDVYSSHAWWTRISLSFECLSRYFSLVWNNHISPPPPLILKWFESVRAFFPFAFFFLFFFYTLSQ